MSQNKPKMCLLVTTPLVIHFFFKPHLYHLAVFFELTIACDLSADRYISLKDLPAREVDIGLQRKISPIRDLFSLLNIIQLFRQQRFDVVVSVVPKAGLLGMLSAFVLRVPYRVHIFQGEVWSARRGPIRWLLKSLDALTARLATHVLAVSASELSFLKSEGVIPLGKGNVLGAGSICGVDTERFRANPRRRALTRAELGIPIQAVVCVFLGRITADKGLVELVKAFVCNASHQTDLWLLLAGPDEDKLTEELLLLVPEEFKSRIIYLGFVDRSEDVLAASDFLCLPSHREGFGMVIIEAAAVGIPAIGTRIHGITDAIKDGVTGRLVSVGDVAGLACAMRRWYDYPQERNAFGAAAHFRVASLFEQRTVVTRYVEFFRDILPRDTH